MKITTTITYFQKNVHINQLKSNHQCFPWYNSCEIWRKRNSKRKVLYAAKKPIKIWEVNVGNIVVSKLLETKSNSKYEIGIQFDKAIRSSVLTMPKMSGYVLKIRLIN